MAISSFLFQTINSSFPTFVIVILASLILFFVIREITLWYFKIDENTDNLKRIADSLEFITLQISNSKKTEKDLEQNENKDQETNINS